ncbi:hypothetical protein RQP46_000227 [Phenoliferia psychrophenolica]
MAKTSILQLPISRSAPIYHLPSDPLFPSPASLLQLSSYVPPESVSAPGPVALKEGDPVPPSMLRRSRMTRGGGVFCYVSPLPLEFPYNIQDTEVVQEKEVGKEVMAKAVTIETKLAEYELDRQFPVLELGKEDARPTAFESARRRSDDFPKPKLLSISTKCADEWLPQLDLGSADGSDADKSTREQLLGVLGGRTGLAREPNPEGPEYPEKLGFAPWALCYGGHQFGSWAGQLGDGRAISILSTPATPEVQAKTGIRTLELQLKGSGRTPYSRFADGLAVLRSSIREYLGAEAMAALKLPTSRALALVGLPSVRVLRERVETAALVTRVAPSWIRIGSLEIQATREEWDTLRMLTKHVGREVFDFDDAKSPAKGSDRGRGLGLAVLREVSARTAVLIAGWQAYGFMHGVNIAVVGSCIDYGPYAFMDVYDPSHVCNHSDEEGRYSYRNQPTMGIFAVQKLGNAMAELIGCEEDLENSESSPATGFLEVDEGWGEGGQLAGWMDGWKKVGLERVEEVKAEFQVIFKDEYTRLMRLRLGLLSSDDGDFDLVSSFLDLLTLHSLDYSSSFRILSQFPGTSSPLYNPFLDHLLESKKLDQSWILDWTKWFEKYEARLAVSTEEPATRRARQDAANPRFVLRQWVLEETIAKVDKEGDLKALDRVLKLSEAPFESYGEKEVGSDVCEKGEAEALERERLCGKGADDMLGFQCSCSS